MKQGRLVDIKRTAASFRHAGRGFVWAIRSQANLRIHLLAVAAVLIAAVALRFSALEFAVLILCFALVLAAELFNTALETLIDVVRPEPHPLIGRAKDAAAAAVLITAIGTALVGIVLFATHVIPHLR